MQSLVRCSLVKYRITDLFPYSALPGFTVDTCIVSVYEAAETPQVRSWTSFASDSAQNCGVPTVAVLGQGFRPDSAEHCVDSTVAVLNKVWSR